MNDKNSILLIDPEFELEAAESCSLVIRISADNFSYAIIDPERNKLLALYDQQECENSFEEFLVALRSDDNLSLKFKEVKASIYTPNNLSVPNELYNANELNDYAKFFSVEQSENLYTQPSHFGFTSIFNLDDVFEKELLKVFTNCIFYDHNRPALCLIKEDLQSVLSLDFTVGTVNCTYIASETLIFQNYYEIENEEEFNYYLLLMIKQLGLDVVNTKILLSGIIHEDDKRHRVVNKYFSDIVFTRPDSDLLESSILDEMPAHYYTATLAMISCG